MRGSSAYTLFLCVIAVVAAAPAFAVTVSNENFNQLDAIATAQTVNKSGSDQSLQSSTTNAMKALMQLAENNRTGAISNGYKAFGEYRNSGDLDALRLRNAISGLKMDSIGNYLAAKGKSSPFLAPISDFDTTYGRLDPKFLRTGEAAKVAEQFEKATGMTRENFLKKMTAASESSIKLSDPQLVDKVLNKFESFVKEIPNAEFRKKVEEQIQSVPQVARTGIISKALQGVTQLVAGAPVGAKSDIATVTKEKDSLTRSLASNDAAGDSKAAAPAPSFAVTGAEAPKAASVDERSLAAARAAAPNLNGRPEYRGIDTEKFGNDALGNVLQTAVDEQTGEDTIFRQISRKYRSLAATLKQ